MDYRGPGLKETAPPDWGTRPSWDPGGLLRNPAKAFGRSLCTILPGFEVPKALKMRHFWVHLLPCACFGENMKTVFSLQSQLHFAGSEGPESRRFPIFFGARFLGMFFRPRFLDFCGFGLILALRVSFIWRPWEEG